MVEFAVVIIQPFSAFWWRNMDFSWLFSRYIPLPKNYQATTYGDHFHAGMSEDVHDEIRSYFSSWQPLTLRLPLAHQHWDRCFENGWRAEGGNGRRRWARVFKKGEFSRNKNTWWTFHHSTLNIANQSLLDENVQIPYWGKCLIPRVWACCYAFPFGNICQQLLKNRSFEKGWGFDSKTVDFFYPSKSMKNMEEDSHLMKGFTIVIFSQKNEVNKTPPQKKSDFLCAKCGGCQRQTAPFRFL